jgi:hypothetical protein
MEGGFIVASKLILIEGLPGSGKTTLARRIKEHLELNDVGVSLFCEGDLHPADLAWCAYVPRTRFDQLACQYPEHAQDLEVNTIFEGDHAIVAYTKLELPLHHALMKCFQDHEVYDARVPMETFIRLHLDRWQSFAEQAKGRREVNIFECAFFQNYICELMAIHGEDDDAITNHLLSLAETVKSLNPTLIYLTQPDVAEAIARIARERVSPDKTSYDDWIDMVIGWLDRTRFAATRGVKGYAGVIRFFEERKRLEVATIKQLPINTYVLENHDYHWDDLFEKVKRILADQGIIENMG